jgi:hypothetical protein
MAALDFPNSPWGLVWLLLALGGCADSWTIKPPIKLSHDLQPGERVVCKGWVFYFGSPGDTGIGFVAHSLECEVKRNG